MIARKPQEIADLFGMYLAKNASGNWFLFPEKPYMNLVYKSWGNSGDLCMYIFNDLISDIQHIDWKDSLCEPKETSMVDKTDLLKKLDEYMDDVKSRQYGINDECEFYYNLWYSKGVEDTVMLIKRWLDDND